VTEMLLLKRGGGDGVAHSFNCTPTFVDMHLADALVSILTKFCNMLLKRSKLFYHNMCPVQLRCGCLPHDAMHSVDFAIARCLSVCLSVTCQYCIETAKCIIILFSL